MKMNRSAISLLAGYAVAFVAGGVFSWAWMAARPTPLPPVGVPKSEPIDDDAPTPVHVEYRPPAPGTTLADLVHEADAVLTAQLTASTVDRVDIGTGPPSLPYSVYTLTVREVVKGDFNSGDSVRIARVGGRGAYEPDFPRPGLGETRLLFLRRFPEAQGYRHLYGRVAFRVVWGELQSMSPLYREVSGRKVLDVLRELRRQAGNEG